ncbi:stage III sporulation protein AG [Aquibacillus salsiterrae]|uniref:Stage III sporulation protein AG n=1 Tax=Aquibacillus salsiterrae TaxID=2950439 RepID=A0A9X3WBL7_9BACI|nr:stage III sporulation protein AG [Aquibacillus salsiterrae]MDC3415488.1 stage III sporulation protein AG [Aquibacillus salsiterrae]
MENPLKKLLSYLHLETGEGKKPTKMGYVLVIALVGILILITSSMFSESKDNNQMVIKEDTENGVDADEAVSFTSKDENKDSALKDTEDQFEKDLAQLLEKITGVSEVEVMVNIDSSKQKVYEKNLIIGEQSTEETDQNGGERYVKDTTKEQQVVIVRQGDKEVPLVVETKKPDVRGVLVVAKGVDHAQVKQWVVEAVSRVLDVPSYKISVMPKN